MKKHIKKSLLNRVVFSIVAFIPSMVFAQPFQGLQGYLKAFGGLLKSVIPILFGLSLVYFFWGLSQFILNDAGNDKTRDEGKKKMIWGVVALFVFLSIYGIINTIGFILGIPIGTPITIPPLVP